MLAPTAMAGSWWDTGWRYSKEISFDISNSSGIAKTELVHFNVTLEPNTTMNCSKELRLTVRGGWCDQNNTCKPTLDEWRRKEITWVKSGKQNNDQYWKYYITNSEPEGWKSTSLDDSGWNQGKTPIGDHNGYRTPWDQDSSSVLVRNSTILNISSLSKVVSAILKVSSDEQAGCWLNEESIFFDFGGGHPDSNWNYVYNIAPRLNLTGKNTLACKVYNINGEQYFDAEITLIVNEWQNTTALTYDPDALENEVPLRVDGEAYSGGYCVAANLTAEVQIYEELGPNLALGKSTLCSGAYSSIYNCSRINDDSYKEEYNNTNQTYDFWMLPNSQTGWARLNLSNNMTINRIRWMNYHDGDSYDAYTTNWAVKTSMSNDTGYSNVQSGVASYKDSYFWTDISFPSRTAQYVQFDVNGYSTRGGLTELQVYNAEIGTRNYRLYYGNPSANKTELRFDSLIATVRNGNPSHVNFTEDYGNGTFKNVMTNIDNISSSTRSVGVADFDNDGDLDIIAADGSCNMYMYLNNGSNVFNDRASLGSFGCNGAPNDIAIGDFNGDGKTDFVTSSDQYNYIYYWENHGNFMFTSNSMPAADWWNSWAKLCGQDDRFLSYPRGKGAADFDNDGDLDVMVLIENYGNSNGRSCMLFALYKNDGKGSFTKEYVSPNYGSGSNMDSHNLIVGEFTGDGNADFIFENGVNNGAGNNGILYLVNGYGNGTFNTSYSEVTRLGERSGGDAYDFDFDGKQDLIVVNYTDALQNGTIHYYRGLGNWSFIGPYNTTNFTRSLAIGGPHFMESRSNVTTGPIRRMTVEGTADALSNGSIIINYQGENWTVPARWEWEWNQTDMMIAGEEYAHHRKIYYNTSFNFTEQPYFNITGWVVNGSALWNGANFSGNLTQPILLNETTIAAKGNDTLWDEGMPKGIPVGKASIGRRQDSAFTTTVNGNAYIIQYFNITNNASSLPANFTNIIVKEGCNANWTCTGFSKIIDSAETTTGWSYDNDANPPATGGLRRVDSYSLNFSWENNDPTTVVAKNFKSSANLGNLTDFQNGNMSMWVFVDSYASFDSIKVIIGSDESNKKGWRRLNTTFSNGWNYLIIDLNSTPSSSSGTINWTNINYLEFTIEGTSYGPDFILIDDWRIWNLGTKEIRIASLNTNEAKLEYGLAKNSNVIATVTEGSNDWRQDTSKTTTAGGTAYIEGNLKINNTDTIKYENVTLLANQSGLSRINWNCYHAGREIYYILTTNTSSDYPIKCSKNAVVTKSEGPWQQSGTATLNSQTINKSVAVENTDPAVSYNNIAWSVNQESACGWSSSTLGGTTNLAANGSAVLEARQSGDCVVNVQSSWKQYMVVESDETGQYIHQNLTIINNANTGMNLTLYASDFSNPTNAFTPVGPYSDPSDYNSPVAIGASQTAVKRQVRSGDVLTQTNGAASEGQTYERLVNVTCSDACDKLSYVKISAGVNDTNYTDFKIYRKNGGIWSFMATPSVSSGTATWYATAFGAVEEYKIWGNSTGVQPPQPAPETPSVNIMSPNSQTYSTGSIWANVTTNISVESCAYSLNGSANQSMFNTSLTSWHDSLSLSDGAYSIRFFCNNSGAVGASEERVFAVDTSLPIVAILSPSGTYGTNSGINLTFTVSVEPNASWYSVDGGAITYAGNTTFDVSGDGKHNVTVWANDSLGKTGSATALFTTDTTGPSITVNSPANDTYYAGWVFANATPNEISNWCGVYLDGSLYSSMAGPSTFFWFNVTAPDGSHNIRFVCNDTLGNSGQSGTVYFSVNTSQPQLPPVLSVQSPQNTTYNYVNNIALNYVQANATACKYSVDGGANTTLSGCANTTFSTTEGSHSTTVFASNTGGEVSQTIYFTTDITKPTITLTSPANGTTYTTDTISISFTLNEAKSWCGYSLNSGANVTVSSGNTMTLSNAGYNLTLYCNDTAGNMNRTGTVFFTVNKQEEEKKDGGSSGGSSGGLGGTTNTNPDLNVTVSPSTLEIAEGSYASFSLTLKNTGNVTLENLVITITGISPDWLSPVQSVNLTKGESKTLTITVTPNGTGEYAATVKAENSKVSRTASLTIKVGGAAAEGNETSGEEAGAGNETAGPGLGLNLDMSGLTGMFTAVTPEVGMAAGMLVVLGIVGFAFFKMLRKY